MKTRLFAIELFLFALVACNQHNADSIETRHGTSLQNDASPILSSIDSLMWQRPDSALTCLLPYFDTCCAANDWHYANLLLSELLYKNDNPQLNRADLLQAVAYFDSLFHTLKDTPSPKHLIAGKDPLSHAQNDNLAFLAARAHYINGVGYYEKDSLVQACAEYLKALEVMESHFEDKDLNRNKARFMSLTFGRLGEMFSEQLLTESAIVCYQQALIYCKREPTSIYGIPVLLHSIGIQFDIANQKDSAALYYDKALANLPDNNNIHYRDIFTSKSVLAYNLGFCVDSIINNLKHVISLTSDEHERTYRFLTLGNILFESRMYDSSLFYLETVFEQQDDIQSRIVAAENLYNIYQKEGDSVKARKYSSFLAEFTMAEIEKKKDISRINEMFKNYLTQKQEKQAEEERKTAVKRVIKIIIPIALLIALVIIILAKLRSKKLLKEQQEEADRMLGETEQQHEKELRRQQTEAEKMLEDKEKHHQQEIEAKEAQARKELEERDKRHAEVLGVERETHRMEQAAMSGRLKRSNQEVRELKGRIKQLDDLATKTEDVASFNEEPICRLIMERVRDGQFKAKIDCKIYKSYALDKQHLLDLRMAADRHFNYFTIRLRKAYPKLTSIDIDYCCLYLLNLSYADVSALMQRAYNTVVERDSKIQKIMGTEKPLRVILMERAYKSSSD